jgi:DNA-binding transcriptional MerR regulator
MDTETPEVTPILKVAWTREAQLNAIASKRSKDHLRIRRWIAILGVLATLFAIMTQWIQNTTFISQKMPLLSLGAQGLFIATPLLASTLAAIASKKYSNGDWLVTRAGAEEIKKEIYFYRTVLQKDENRRRYLEDRLARIQRQIHRALNNEFSFQDYKGPVPSSYKDGDPNSDPGYADLSGDEYFRYRLENQLNWHNRKINQFKKERDKLTVLILVIGALGSVIATLGAANSNLSSLSIWVALTASITAGLIGWQELRNIDVIVRNYSKVVLELTILKDHWLNLSTNERTATEFYKLVRDCEEVLWAQNTEYIKSMQEALRDHSFEEDANLVNNIVTKLDQQAQQTKQAMADHVDQVAGKILEEGGQRVEQTFQTTANTLADEFMSEVVQKELDSMSQAVTQAAGNLIERASAGTSSLNSILPHIAQAHSDVEVGRDTSKEELNQILASLPKTGELKG